MWPPASIPSMTSASPPERSSFFASASVGANTMTFAPNALIASTLPLGGIPPASTTWPTPCLPQTSISSNSIGCMVIRLTPNGLPVSAFVPAISASSSSGVIAPHAITPNPPALLIAATRLRSDTQLIAPHRIAWSQPRKAAPRASSSRSRARPLRGNALTGSFRVEAIGGVQDAHRQFRLILVDQDGHLDLAGRYRLDIDAALAQRLEHHGGDARMALHAHAHDADLGHL